MTSERMSYLQGRKDAREGKITLQDAIANAGMTSFRALYFLGAQDELTNKNQDWA